MTREEECGAGECERKKGYERKKGLANAYTIKMKKTRMRSLEHSLIIPVWSHPVLKLISISV